MSWEKLKREITNVDNKVQALNAKSRNSVQEVGAAIEEFEHFQAAKASDRRRLFESNEQLLQIEVEQETIKKNAQALDNNDLLVLAQMLALNFNKLGYNLNVSRDADNMNMALYRFDHGPDRYITARVENGQLSLVQMCPQHPGFLRIKEYLSESQDLIGLLTSFATK
ncbi:uncharacterized protein LOC117793740 [Drosophila innubila]|uniref:uncharacterized protein LOC117793740 n=1 Tax=Drosophila innubila TaxID=198719 RepID=UPI00148DE9E9|nr:uncharacterized protein LOC117793740 [Drosophila innubila]